MCIRNQVILACSFTKGEKGTPGLVERVDNKTEVLNRRKLDFEAKSDWASIWIKLNIERTGAPSEPFVLKPEPNPRNQRRVLKGERLDVPIFERNQGP